jgi:hypothetical protein
MVCSSKFRATRSLLSFALWLPLCLDLAILVPALAQTAPALSGPEEDRRPLSPAQIALFETPHLRNVARPETLHYTYRRVGPAGFTDTVAVHVQEVNSDGTKNLTFDYLSGPRRVLFPGVDHFRGNPLLMLVLDRDVAAMKDAVGLSANYFRNRIRESFVEAATIREGNTQFDGGAIPARVVTVQPFAHETRLERIASLQAKTYTFVLAEAVPGMIAEIRIDTPEDLALHAPAIYEQITFTGVDP